MRIALVQMKTVPDNDENVAVACGKIREASENGADIVVLPEMFCCPYVSANFPAHARNCREKNCARLSECAAESRIYLVAGSMPEEDGGKIYNTSFVFDRNGTKIARHRKMHLFNCDFKGGPVFHESETLSAGNSVTTFETEFGVLGLMICFDVRFPELTRLMALRGARMAIVPAAFNMTSGPRWWELIFRARAADNQLFMAGCSPARDESAPYVAWGHSLVVNPSGAVTAVLDEKDGILYSDADFSEIEDVRAQQSVLGAMRTDVYRLTEVR